METSSISQLTNLASKYFGGVGTSECLQCNHIAENCDQVSSRSLSRRPNRETRLANRSSG